MIHDHLEMYFETESVPRGDSRVLRMVANERISQTYRVEVELAIRDSHTTTTADLLGIDGAVVIDDFKGKSRRFWGVVAEVEEMPETREWKCFRLVLRPHAWIATLISTYDIHLDATVPQIVAAKVGEVVKAEPKMRLSEAYAPREIVTQYAESDHAFVARLCEHVGIFSFYEHAEDGEQLVFGDATSAYTPIAEDDAVPFADKGSEASVFAITERRALVPALYVCRDYNYRNPQLEVAGQHQLAQGFAGGHIEYGSHVRDEAQAKRLAGIRAEEQRARHDQFVGRSSDFRFAPGHTFTLTGHPRHALRLVLVEVVHEARQPLFEDIAMAERGYENRFVSIPAEVAFRPPRETPVPKIHGLVTGIVETSQGELESYAKIDDQGRYTVAFLFDAGGADRTRASAPVRMAQASAGPGYGNHFPLKPGVEVVIAFVDGNADRPIIVGAVPNPLTPTPVTVAESTKSRIQTRSGILIEFEDANRRA
jgi:type VI secretion system secreted protein VgrG